MTVEQDKEQTRRNALTALWMDRHPEEEMTGLDVALMDCLVVLGAEYDASYRDKEKERRLFKLSNQLRQYLGIEIVTIDRKGQSPTNENKKLDKKNKNS